MRTIGAALFSSMTGIVFVCTVAFADNPIIQTSFTADPAPLVYHDTLFLYTGDDSLCDATNTGFFMRYWKCYSTTDMANWTYRAIILPTRTVSWAGGDANAAQCVHRNGKFFFYFTSTYQGSQAVGVAVADNPLGPFADIGKPIIPASQMTGCNATHGWRGLDPTVWIDDDGQAYLYWGNNVCYWVRLNANMTSTTGSISCLAQNNAAFGPDFEEAPWLFKRDGRWYLLYASRIPENIGCSMSSGPEGPWTFKGIISTAPSGQNGNHPGYIEYKGNPYLFSFYDKNGLPNATNYRRSVCVEQFKFNPDGTIPTVVFSKSGPPQIGRLNPYDTVQAETICWSAGLRARPCNEGGMHIDSIHNGDYIKVKGVDFGIGGAKSFEARVASATNGGSIELRLDTITGPPAGTCAVSGTGGWQTWTTKSCTVSDAAGVHDLFLKFTGGSGLLFNFNWWKFTPAVGTDAAAPGAKGEAGSAIRVSLNGETRTLRLYFPPSFSRGNVGIRLFDAAGHPAATLHKGRVTSPHLSLPLGPKKMGPGAYFVSVSLNGSTVLTKTILLK